MPVRIRLPELLDEHDLTAYTLAQRSAGRIDASTLYRIIRKGGAVRFLDADLLDALCEALGVPLSDVVERQTSVTSRESATTRSQRTTRRRGR